MDLFNLRACTTTPATKSVFGRRSPDPKLRPSICPQWPRRVIYAMLNTIHRTGGAWLQHGSIEEDAIKGVMTITK